jgi:thiol-disulfide isomerase/thioredoxin
MENKNKPQILSFNSGFLKKIGIALFGFLFITSFSYTQNRSIIFESGKWQEIKDKAKKENKLIFVDCYTTWCGPCKSMSKNIFTNDTVADFFNKNFICAKFDMEKDEGLMLSKEYNINRYPTFIFADGDGNLVHRGCGLQPVNSFIELGNNALDPQKHFINYEEQYKKGNRDASFILSYLRVMEAGGVNIKEVKDDYFITQKESDLTSQINWAILYRFTNDLKSREFKYIMNHKDEYAKIYTLDSVNMLIDYNISMALIPVVFKDTTGKAFSDFMVDIKKSKVPNVEEIELCGKMFLTSAKEKWNDYAVIAVAYIEKYKMDDSRELNDVAWNFYENINDKSLLEKALIWAKQSVNLKPRDTNYDTYACLMFKLGNKDEAIKLEEEAIKFAKEMGKPTTEYEKNIEKFKK